MPFGFSAAGAGGGFAPSGPVGGSAPAFSVGSGGSRSVPGMIPGMVDVYNQLRGDNMQNYQRILSGYSDRMGSLQQQLAGVSQGYGNIYQGIVGTMQGAGNQAMTDANAAFTKARGDITQNQMSAGFGSSSVAASLQNQQAALMARNAQNIREGVGNTLSGYASNLGQAQMQNYMQGLAMQNSLTQSYLGDLSGYHFANTAGNLEGQYSASQAAAQGYGSGGGGGGRGGYGGVSSGDNGMLGWGGLGATATGWINQPTGGVGYSGGYTGGGYYSPYTAGGGGGGNPNQIYSGGLGTPTTGGVDTGDLLSGLQGLMGGGGE